MKLIINAFLTISSAFISFLLGYWFIQPDIEYFNDDYCQQVNGISIGTIYMVNNGRGVDEDIAITYGIEIPKENIHVSFLTSTYEIEIINHHTVVKISKLCPGEDAEITFRAPSFMEKFSILNFTSKSGNITEIRDILRPWWYLSPYQIKIFTSILVLVSSLTYYIGARRLRINEIDNKKNRKESRLGISKLTNHDQK